MKSKESIYIHIPFCVKKCKYCDFLSWTAKPSVRDEYVGALVKEISASKDLIPAGHEVTSVYMGGGTPSILESPQIERIFEALTENFSIEKDAEITMEMNPGTATDEKLKAMKKVGVNRLSIGLQSTDIRELQLLGRIHTYDDFLSTYEMARREGFHNINVDLISAIPGQTLSSWSETLEKTAKLGPEHISAYSLIVEKGTLFYDIYSEEGKVSKTSYPPLPDEDTEREIYRASKMILKKYGYHRYEISNYAREGFECRHNKGCWQRDDYLGLGLGASSFLNHLRFHNTSNFLAYLKKSSNPKMIREEVHPLSLAEEMEEFMFLGLRMTRGISFTDFKNQFNIPIRKVYGEKIDQMTRMGLLTKEGDFLKLTERGIDVSNQVFVEFLDPLSS